MNNKTMPKISIVLPTFNRAQFLLQAFISLNSQTRRDWKLIIVDDGSTDDTCEKVRELQSQYNFELKYIYQENGGPAKARNTGIESVDTEYVAFFDSDDTWDESYLHDALTILENERDIDWLYFACRRINFYDKSLLLESTFHTNDSQNSLFSLVREKRGEVYILDNQGAALEQIKSGIDSGLQNSVLRTDVVKTIKIPEFRIGEDRLFILQALKLNFTLAFVDKVAVNYFVHNGNTSDTNSEDEDFPKRIKAMQNLIESYVRTSDFVKLNIKEQKALNQRLADDYFWKLGYSLYVVDKRYKEALAVMFRGITLSPFNIKFYKTYLITFFKFIMSK